MEQKCRMSNYSGCLSLRCKYAGHAGQLTNMETLNRTGPLWMEPCRLQQCLHHQWRRWNLTGKYPSTSMWTFSFYMINCENLEKTSLGIAMSQSHPQFCSTPPAVPHSHPHLQWITQIYRSSPSNFPPLPLLPLHCFIWAPSTSRHFLGTHRPLLAGEVGRLASDLHLSLLSPKPNPPVSSPALQHPLTIYPLFQSITHIFPSKLPQFHPLL